MDNIIYRRPTPEDLDDCYQVEISGFSQEEAASKETIKLRMEIFPQGFLVAESNGLVIGMLNSGCTNKDDISDEELKQLIGHDPNGKNMVIFALVVLPEYRGKGIAPRLVDEFANVSRKMGKESLLLLCKKPLVKYYEKLGFELLGLSKSRHGGAEWFQMRMGLI